MLLGVPSKVLMSLALFHYVHSIALFYRWALSTLFVDVNDIMPENITAATDPILHVNLMPAYGLNVFSMLKHKTLVLTLDALNHIEDKLLKATRRLDKAEVCVKSKEKHHDTKIL